VVTVLFCDVVGSTALGESVDPEALQGLLARYFERMKVIVESHGGSVEKFIGDAVMAVFGVPAVHEDDALRACRAAVEMRAAFPELLAEETTCWRCGLPPTPTDPLVAGHVIARRHGGPTTRSNMRAEHRSCNTREGEGIPSKTTPPSNVPTPLSSPRM
jgi:hypothetical protein